MRESTEHLGRRELKTYAGTPGDVVLAVAAVAAAVVADFADADHHATEALSAAAEPGDRA